MPVLLYQCLSRVSQGVCSCFRRISNPYLPISAFSFSSLLCIFSISLVSPDPLHFLISDLILQWLGHPLETSVSLTRTLGHLYSFKCCCCLQVWNQGNFSVGYLSVLGKNLTFSGLKKSYKWKPVFIQDVSFFLSLLASILPLFLSSLSIHYVLNSITVWFQRVSTLRAWLN